MGLWDELLSHSASWAWVWEEDRYERRSFATSFDGARHVSAALRARGVRPGDVVGAVITNSTAAMDGFLGAWWAGATVASLPIIARGQGLEEYLAQLRGLCASIGAQHLLIEDRFGQILLGAGLGAAPEVVSFESLRDHPARADIAPRDEDEVIFIQFSSGTTAAPRGVELTARTIDAQLRRLGDRIGMDASDLGAMWLPLSHDMGFFGGVILAWYTGMCGVLSSPERFLAQPWTWFEDCARLGATITVGPSFAFHVAARTRLSRALPGPLSLRVCVTGGEPVMAAHLRACEAAFAEDGLRIDAFLPAYGLAEATLAVTAGSPDAAPATLWARSEGLFEGDLELCEPGEPGARELVSCGRPLSDFRVAVAGEVGELTVSGPSLARGYHGAPELTAARFGSDGFLTGDVGFTVDGELYVVGRLDDRLIVAGRNIDVSDLELEIGARGGVRKGNCAVVDVRRGTRQRIVLVAEIEPGTGPDDLLMRVREIAARRHGLRIDELVAVERGQFPKTPSGKAQRYRCRDLAAGALT